MRFVFFSDLHLEAPFGWDGPSLVRQRRNALQLVLGNILTLADEVEADAVLCGGDLYEYTLAGSDTGEFLRSAFESIAPVSVFISPGNHDWYSSQSLYERTEWSHNVHIFREGSMQAVHLESGLTLWGAAHRGPAELAGFLDTFQVDGDGIHIALFHGSEASGMSHESSGDSNAPFSRAQIPASGLHHAFVGHYHEHHDGAYHTYPGNPDPLSITEQHEVGSRNRGAVVVDVLSEGSIERRRRRVAVTEIHDLTIDAASTRNADELHALVQVAVTNLTGIARVTVEGVAGYETGLEQFAEIESSLDGIHFRVDP